MAYIELVFEREGADAGRLVAIVDEDDRDVQAGTWVEREDGQHALRLPVPEPPPDPLAPPRATVLRNPQTGAELAFLPTGRTFFEMPTDEPTAAGLEAVVIQLRRRNARQLKIVAEIPVGIERLEDVIVALRKAAGR